MRRQKRNLGGREAVSNDVEQREVVEVVGTDDRLRALRGLTVLACVRLKRLRVTR